MKCNEAQPEKGGRRHSCWQGKGPGRGDRSGVGEGTLRAAFRAFIHLTPLHTFIVCLLALKCFSSQLTEDFLAF